MVDEIVIVLHSKTSFTLPHDNVNLDEI